MHSANWSRCCDVGAELSHQAIDCCSSGSQAVCGLDVPPADWDVPDAAAVAVFCSAAEREPSETIARTDITTTRRMFVALINRACDLNYMSAVSDGQRQDEPESEPPWAMRGRYGVVGTPDTARLGRP